MDHWESEHNMSSTTGKRDADIYSPKSATANDSKTLARHWEITSGNLAKRKGKRSTFTNAKRKKVANVRKLGACDYHRKKVEISLSL